MRSPQRITGVMSSEKEWPGVQLPSKAEVQEIFALVSQSNQGGGMRR